jgi:integrase
MTKEPARRRSQNPDKPAVLTDAAIKKYVPSKERRRRIRDLKATGLFLIVEPSGTKAFEMRFRRPDLRPAKIRLGKYSEDEIEGDPVLGQRMLTLAAARQLAAEVHRRRALGEDVIGEHKAEKRRRRTEVKDRETSSFGVALRDFVREYAQRKTRRWRDTARLLGLRYDESGKIAEEIRDGLATRWGDKDVRAIDASAIWQIVDEAKRTGTPGIPVRRDGFNEERARKLFMALSALFKWLHRGRRITVNPCPGTYHVETAPARDRVLSADEIRWFWQATETVDAPRVAGAPKPFKPLLRLLLLTGARLNEVAQMRRGELHADGTWQLPGERTKNKRPHAVALPPPARELIANMPDKGGDFVFTTNGKSPVSGWNRMKRRLDARMAELAKAEKGAKATIPPWRVHDLRRTAVTGMAELGIRPDVIELCVNHQSGARGGIAGVYNRSELLPERKTALERWAAHLAGLMAPKSDTIIRLPRRRGGK